LKYLTQIFNYISVINTTIQHANASRDNDRVRVAVVVVSGGGGRVAGTSLAHEGFKPRVQR